MNNRHEHGPDCNHQKVAHGNHMDYLNDDGTLECVEGAHPVAISAKNPDGCKPIKTDSHIHSPNCGHQPVQHGSHTDYLVEGKLEHPHGDHNDDHGVLS